jgi:hypothetical protein
VTGLHPIRSTLSIPNTSTRSDWTLYARSLNDETFTAVNNALNGGIESP